MSLFALLLAVAALELDQVLFAQTLLSRPLAVGALIGVLRGHPGAGFVTGACFEYLSLADLPVGGNLTWSAPVATAVALCVYDFGAVPALSFGYGFAAGLAAGWLHARLEAFERGARKKELDGIESAVRKDAAPPYGRAMARSLFVHAAWTFAFLRAAVFGFSFLGESGWLHAPSSVGAGLGFAANCAPWLGLSSLAVWGFRRA